MKIDAFIRDNTQLLSPPLVPELKLHLASEVVPLWRKTEEELNQSGIAPPYWAFAWPGGQALGRYVLDHPEFVRGKRVLDFGAGSGLVALAAAKAGALHVTAADIDPTAAAAIRANARANGLAVEVTSEDLIGAATDFAIIMIGDMCYERPLAERLLSWLAGLDVQILMGDPGRTYFPKSGFARLATYMVPTSLELEDREIRETGIWTRESRQDSGLG
jgi:predicted nicotinamide N-methyase